MNLAVISGGLVLVIAGIHASANLVNMVLLAYVVVLLATPILHWLTKKRVPLFVSVVIILLLIVTLIAFVLWIVVISLGQLIQDLPQYSGQLETTAVSWQQYLAQSGIDFSQIQIPASISSGSVLQSVLAVTRTALTRLSNVIVTLGLVLVIVFFALFEVPHLSKRFSLAFAGNDNILSQLSIVNTGVQKYLILKAVTGIVMAAGNIVFLLVMNVQFALLWGLLTFLMNFIPNIGFMIALIPPVVMAFLQYGAGTAVIVLAGYLIINTLVNTLLAPRLMGRGLHLSPTVIFVALIFWAWVLGGVGVFMAVPLLIMMKTLMGQFDDTKWLATAVSDDAAI